MHLSRSCKGFILLAIKFSLLKILKGMLIQIQENPIQNTLQKYLPKNSVYIAKLKQQLSNKFGRKVCKSFYFEKYICTSTMFQTENYNFGNNRESIWHSLYFIGSMRGLRSQSDRLVEYIDYIKPKRRLKPSIKSKSYRKKYDEGLPKLGEKKEIPFHYLYEVAVPANQVQKNQEPDAWAVIKKDIHRRKLKNRQAQFNKTFYDIFIEKYIQKSKKRATRQNMQVLQPHQHRSLKDSSVKFYPPRTVIQFRKKSKSTLQCPKQFTQQKNNQQTIDQLFNSVKQPLRMIQNPIIYGKNFRDMTIEQLRQGITWKKKFIDELNAKKPKNTLRSFSKAVNTITFNKQKSLESEKIDGY